MGVFDRLSDYGKAVVAELQIAAGTPKPKSIDRNFHTVRSDTVETHFPDKDKLERYWELYKNTPIIRQPIRSFAAEVVAPGYYIDAEDEDLKEELEEWLGESAIVDGEINKDFRRLLKKSAIQREVKGTALVEKVPDDEGNLYGFKLMRPETVRAFTYPGQNLLIPPDADLDSDGDNKGGRFSVMGSRDYYKTQDGDAAAYVQLASGLSPSSDFDEDGYIPFTRDRVIKLNRDPDTGEIFGNSRLEAVEDRLESLLKKLDDNDKAIESLAHPYLLFRMGVGDEGPWEPDKIQALASEHEQDQYQPGLKQFVQGDIDVEQISGDVAPIDSFLDFDINWIMSEMPMPRYALGGFESEVNQFVSRSQETRLENQIGEARQEIIEEWTPVLKEKAEELDYDADDVNSLVIGDEQADMMEDPEEDQEGNNQGAGGTNFTRPPASSEDSRVENDNGD